jgi:hypothetical protein
MIMLSWLDHIPYAVLILFALFMLMAPFPAHAPRGGKTHHAEERDPFKAYGYF